MANPVVNAAIRRLIQAGFPEGTARKIATGELSMDPAAKAARMSDQGYFDIYHGGAGDISAFDPATFGGSTTGAKSAQMATWGVDDPRVAETYARYAGEDVPVQRLIAEADAAGRRGDFDLQERLYLQAEALEQSGELVGGGGQNVMPLMARGNYLDKDAKGGTLSDLDEGQIAQWVQEAKDKGYDGVRIRDFSDNADYGVYLPATHYGIIDPTKIRSRFAAFDPDELDNPNILAGLGAAGVGAGLMAPEEAEAAGFGTLARAIGQGTRRVFTGSPAEYTQPSLQKIGTGEGNQAFGYGLYFSESPGVATGYRKILSGEKLIKRLEDQELDPDLYAEDVSEMLDEGVFGEAETRFLRALEEADYLGFDHPYQAVRATFSPRMGFDMGDEAVVNLLKMRDEMGFLYETEIPADAFLDWDLPLADQPAIVQRVVDEVARRQPERFDATMMRRYQEGKMKGKEAYYLFSQNPQEASQVWANYGVPGVRYSSQGRRSAAQKEMIPQNYVVFDDKLINMVSRNDVPLEGNFDEEAARQALDPEMLRSRLRQMGPVGTVAASAGAVASPLERPEDAERRANARAVAVASDTLERLRRERGAVASPLDDTGAYRLGAYLTENRPSEMDPVQRALQSLGMFQGIGEYLRTVGEGQRTTTMQDINAALDIVPL